jgi:hypothetical protein
MPAKAKTAVKRRANKRRATKPAPPKGYVMSVDDLAALTGASRNNTYRAVASGVYPSIRHGRKIMVLVAPALAILSGEREPGPSRRPSGRTSRERRPHRGETGRLSYAP